MLLTHRFNFLKIASIILIFGFLSSCIVHYPSDIRGIYSYYRVTEKEHPNFIQRPESNLCEKESEEPFIIYRIRANELKACLVKSTKSIVYFWSPNCSAPVCIPPNYAQEYSSRQNVDLLIIATYYDYQKMNYDYNLDRPLLGIDTEYYRSNLTSRYLDRFKTDLIGKEAFEENKIGRFYLFESDSLVMVSSSIEELEI